MSGLKSKLNGRTLLENLLLAMGFGGIGLTVLVSLLVMASGLFFPDQGTGLLLGFLIGVLGVTAGIGLIALSHILGYLRVIASGMGPGKVFE